MLSLPAAAAVLPEKSGEQAVRLPSFPVFPVNLSSG
jgi:hypothetical protein